MTPLLLVGLLYLSPALGDVSHILEGHAPAPKPSEINQLAAAKNPQDFWWMANDSPLKHAYDHYKKCSLKGNCGDNVAVVKTAGSGTVVATAAAGNIDLKKNPFLNGEYQKKAKPSGFHTGTNIDLSNNPFLSGNYNYNNLGQKISNDGGFIGVQPAKPFATNHPLANKKPFSTVHPLSVENVSGQSGQSGSALEKGSLCKGQGYTCVNKGKCVNGLVQGDVAASTIDVQFCSADEVCCRVSGPIPEKIDLHIPTLDADSKIQINNLDQVTAGKSSILGSSVKFTGGAGLSPGSIKILSDLDPQISVAGESGQFSASTVKTRDVSDNFVGSSTVDYSNVEIGNEVRFGSTIQGPAYLPPCGPGLIQTPNGGCAPPPTTPRPQPPPVVCGFNQIKTPSGGCVDKPTPPPVICGFNQIKTPSGGCIDKPTPPPVVCGPNQIKTPNGQCINRPTPPPVTEEPNNPPPSIRCPPGQTPLPGGGCQPAGYLPPVNCPPGQFKTASGECRTPSTPPPPPPPVTCPPGYIKTASGQCLPPPTTTPRPSCLPGQVQTPTGGCVYLPPPPVTCAPGQIKTASGQCQYPPPPTTPSIICAPGQYKTPQGQCVYPPTTPSPPVTQPDTQVQYFKCPPGQFRNPATKQCEIQERPTYLPPDSPTTPGYHYPTPTPAFNLPDNKPDGTNNNVNRVPNPTTGEKIQTVSLTTPTPDHAGQPSGNQVLSVPLPGCAAALKCVQEIYCTAEGTVSAVPVILTKEQELLKVPTTACSDAQSGTTGVCCRDPNYKDPWPSANLVNGEDDGQYKEDNHFGESQVRNVRANPVATRSILPGALAQQTVVQNQEQCGSRNLGSQPKGLSPIDMNFAEIPWQAMILRDSNRSLLCGGAIIARDAVLTTAHCVEGLLTSDVLIKGGEWKLGIDEEPLPFQIVKVAAIVRHPQYQHGSRVNDLAILKLEEKLRLAKNVGTICLPKPNQIPTTNCITTGWGKRILQLHAKNALMHGINVNIMDSKQCEQTLTEKFKEALPHYSPNTLCGFSDIDQCKVDHGSALACSDTNGQYTLSGIFAWDTGCKQEGQIGGYVAPDVEWIQGCLAKPLPELKRLDNEYQAKSTN